jgi:hypothetical protein
MHGSVGASGSTFEPHSHRHYPLTARPPVRSVSAALIFMFGFHGALAVTAILNWKVPCDQPLQWFLLLFGLAGLAGSLAYFVLEVVLNREQLPGVPDTRKGGRTPKLVVATLLALAFGIGLMGTILLATGAQTSTCAVTAPIVHKWAYAAALAFCIFGSLLLFVPLIAVLLPFLALALMPLIACLATCAQWMDAVRRCPQLTFRRAAYRARLRSLLAPAPGCRRMQAGRRGPFGAVGSLQRLLRLAPEEEAPLLGTNSNFALYVNTTALCWFFTYLLVEVRRNWLLACDAPLHVFVGAVAVLGLGLSVLDFMHDVFKVHLRCFCTGAHSQAFPAGFYVTSGPDAAAHQGRAVERQGLA